MDSTLSYFDLAINALPWTPYRRSQITKARALTGNLCFDELLSLADIDSASYPPNDIVSLRHLLTAIDQSHFDNLKTDCLIYYLLKDYPSTSGQKGAAEFAADRLIPTQFVKLTDGYWLLDNGSYERAVTQFSSFSVTPDFTTHILLTLSRIPNDRSLSSKLVLRFLRACKPAVESAEEINVKLDALLETNIREAWMYMRSFEKGPLKASLVVRVLTFCLSPKPRPAHLRQLLAFPFSPFEEASLLTCCLTPPSSIPPSSLSVLYDFVHVRLVSQGRLLAAIKLDRSLGATDAAADQRRQTIQSLVRLLPEVQRRILEFDMDREGMQLISTKSAGSAGASNEMVVDGVDEQVDSSTGGDPPGKKLFPQGDVNLPLSASQAFRSSVPQLAIHRAVVASPGWKPTPGSPRAQSTTPYLPPSTGSHSPKPKPSIPVSPFSELSKSLLSQRPQTGSTSNPFLAPPSPKPSSLSPSSGPPRSPFAQAAQQASAAYHRSNAAPSRTIRRFTSSRSSVVDSSLGGRGARAQEDEESAEEDADRPNRAFSTNTKKETPKGSRKVVEKTREEEDVDMDRQESQAGPSPSVSFPGAFPGSADPTAASPSSSNTATTKTRSNRSSGPDPAVPSEPRTTRGSSRSTTKPRSALSNVSFPGTFQADAEEGDHPTELPSPTTTRRSARSSTLKRTLSSTSTARRSSRSISTRTNDSSSDEEDGAEGKTPPPRLRARSRMSLRSNATASPEAVPSTRRRATRKEEEEEVEEHAVGTPKARSKKKATAKPASQSGKSTAASGVATRRSTRSRKTEE